MDVSQLRSYVANLEELFAAKVRQQREILKGQLAELQGYVSSKAAKVVRTIV